ncbi:hypothetical protein JW905_05390 [bacterium]|nr:hypothetical protein [candidate division CSSED10-310 bacterium]
MVVARDKVFFHDSKGEKSGDSKLPISQVRFSCDDTGQMSHPRRVPGLHEHVKNPGANRREGLKTDFTGILAEATIWE